MIDIFHKQTVNLKGYLWEKLLGFMQLYENKTSKIPLKDIVALLDYLNSFCEEYGITQTSIKRNGMIL